jgi:hypothetical protein
MGINENYARELLELHTWAWMAATRQDIIEGADIPRLEHRASRTWRRLCVPRLGA